MGRVLKLIDAAKLVLIRMPRQPRPGEGFLWLAAGAPVWEALEDLRRALKDLGEKVPRRK